MVRLTPEQSTAIERIAVELSCPRCKRLLNDPYTTDCGHHFCKSCIDEALFIASSCPECGLPQFPVSLKRNTSVANLVRSYNEIKLYLSLIQERNRDTRNEGPRNIEDILGIASQNSSSSGKSQVVGKPLEPVKESQEDEVIAQTNGSTMHSSSAERLEESKTISSNELPVNQPPTDTSSGALSMTSGSNRSVIVPNTQQIDAWQDDLMLAQRSLSSVGKERDTHLSDNVNGEQSSNATGFNQGNSSIIVGELSSNATGFDMGKLGDSQLMDIENIQPELTKQNSTTYNNRSRKVKSNTRKNSTGKASADVCSISTDVQIDAGSDGSAKDNIKSNAVQSVGDTQFGESDRASSVMIPSTSGVGMSDDKTNAEGSTSPQLGAKPQQTLDVAETQFDGQQTLDVAETQFDGQQTLDVAETQFDGQQTLDVAETQFDGQQTQAVAETQFDGQQTQAVAETQFDGQQQTQAVAETQFDGQQQTQAVVETQFDGQQQTQAVAETQFDSKTQQTSSAKGSSDITQGTQSVGETQFDKGGSNGSIEREPFKVPNTVSVQHVNPKQIEKQTNPEPVRIVPTGLKLREVQAMEKISEDLGWSFNTRFEKPWPTHLVLNTKHVTIENQSMIELDCVRSAKYLLGLTHGCWILSKEWLFECGKLGKKVAEEPYQVNFDPMHTVYIPRRARERALGRRPKILQGFRVYLGPWDSESPELHKHQAAHLLRGNGAKVIDTAKWVGVRAPMGNELFPKETTAETTITLISHPGLRVCDTDGTKRCVPAHLDCLFCEKKLKWMRKYLKCDTLDISWLVQCIVSQELRDIHHVLHHIS